MKLQPGKIVCFVHGEYSDFCVDAHAVVLREFDPRKIMSEVDHVGEYNDLWEFPEAYVKSLADSGYIRVLKDEEEVFEIYIER